VVAQRLVIRPEVIRMKEKEDAPAGLISDRRLLFFVYRARQQYVGTLFSGRPDAHPSLASCQRSILNHFEAQLVAVELLGLVILSHEQSSMDHRADHRSPLACTSIAYTDRIR